MRLDVIKRNKKVVFDCKKDYGKLCFKYFRDFYLDVSGRYSKEELDEAYHNYCIKYFNMFGEEYDKERKEIWDTYLYLVNMKGKNSCISSYNCYEFLSAYHMLIDSLDNYGFEVRDDATYGYGANQNAVNDDILFDISLLNDFIVLVVKRVDSFITNASIDNREDEFYNQLVEKMESLKEKLVFTEDILNGAEVSYHETWTACNRPRISSIGYCTKKELGDAKKFWRLMRNNACHEILEVCRELADINIALSYQTFDYKNMSANVGVDYDTASLGELYNCGIKNIINGPYYFSYLDEEQKVEIAEEKVLKKIQNRKSSNG